MAASRTRHQRAAAFGSGNVDRGMVAVSGETHSLPPEEGGHQGRVARRSEHAPAGFRAVRAYWLQEWGSWSENKKACYL